MGDSVAITLIRHGITQENREKRYLGWSDVQLSLEGKRQLQEYKKMGYPDGDFYMVSDLLRCRETFYEVYDRNKNVRFSQLFREINFGEWELQTYDQLKGQSRYQNWLENYDEVAPPHGESFTYFRKRVMAGWQMVVSQLKDKKHHHIVVISHGGPIRVLLEAVAPEQKDFWNWSVPHGTGYTLTTTLERLRRNERCILLQEVPFREKVSGSVPTII